MKFHLNLSVEEDTDSKGTILIMAALILGVLALLWLIIAPDHAINMLTKIWALFGHVVKP